MAVIETLVTFFLIIAIDDFEKRMIHKEGIANIHT